MKFAPALVALLVAVSATAQTSAPRKPPAKKSSESASGQKRAPAAAPRTSPLVAQAEEAIEKQDYATAEAKLKQAAAADPADYTAWFNLGFVYNATERKPEAIEAYRKAVKAKPDLFEANLNLGILLASSGRAAEAEPVLLAATTQTPSSDVNEGRARAFLSLARIIEEKNPAKALEHYEKAATLRPLDPDPLLSAGAIYERWEDYPSAQQRYEAARKLDPQSQEALTGLINVYMKSRQLPQAESALKDFLQANPNNAQARLQLGRVLAAQGKSDEALAALQAGHGATPNDPDMLRELAAAMSEAGQHQQAAELYNRLLQQNPNDFAAAHGLGRSLMQLRRFPEAEKALLAALKLKKDSPEALSDLALSAAENKHHELTVLALDARAKITADTPGTWFLRATAYDHLGAKAKAIEAYKEFLKLAAGKYPEQEWQARHRLKAIEPR